MIPPAILRHSSKDILGMGVLALLLLGAPGARAQHGGRVGGSHVSAPSHASAPPPARMPAPRPAPRPPVAVAAPRVQSPVMIHQPPPHFTPLPSVIPPPGNAPRGAGQIVVNGTILPHTAIGFPRTHVLPQPSGASLPGQSDTTFYGDGHDFWRDAPKANTVRPGFGTSPRIGIIGVGRRRSFPFPRRTFPVFYPVFYPVGFFGGFPAFGYGLGFGACDPFWGFGCQGFGYGNYLFDSYPATLTYQGPSESTYLPVPSDGNTADDQDEAVLYFKDGTVYLISNYWLANNQIHYVTSNGAEHVVDMDSIDLQKTVDVNAKRGVAFTLRPAPGSDVNSDGQATPRSPNQVAPEQGNPQQ